MKIIFRVLFSTLILVLQTSELKTQEEASIIISSLMDEITQWVGYDKETLEVAKECGFQQNTEKLLSMHNKLSQLGVMFSKPHIKSIISILKEDENLKQFLTCMIEKRNTENQFFNVKKKYKLLAQFIQKHPDYAGEIFISTDKPFDKGFRLGRFFKAFFEYVYFFVLNPSQTVSTTLIRAITVKTDIFQHQDISPCLSLETSGAISDNLENLSIQNIYIQIPAAFQALKYMKIKQKCRTQRYMKYAQNLSERIKKVDLFKVMYQDYTPYVEIAAEKYGNKQIQRLGSLFANIINNPQIYAKMSLDQSL